jgi:Na+-driven multidrug efflux pump
MAFGVLFAMSGSVGPIIGQNLGAKRFDRIRSTVTDSIRVACVYCLITSVLLALCSGPIARAFGARGQAYDVVVFFCVFIAGSFVFSGMLFVANAAFNNLGYALYSTALNWGRATLGVLPFVWLGGLWFGPRGVVAGSALGALVFGLLAIWLCYRVIEKLDQQQFEQQQLDPPQAEQAQPETPL